MRDTVPCYREQGELTVGRRALGLWALSRSGEAASFRCPTAHDGDELALRHIQVDAFQNLDTPRSRGDNFGEAANLNHDRRRDSSFIMRTYFFVACLFLAACGDQPKAEPPAARPAVQPAAAPEPDGRRVIVAFGDSLSAGFGVDAGQGYPDFLQKQQQYEKLSQET